MGSVEILLLNAIVYTITLLYFLNKYKISVGVIVWSLYTASTWATFLFVQQPGYVGTIHDSEQTILPCVYLYFIFLVTMTPLMRFYRIDTVDFSRNWKLLRAIIVVCTIIQFVFVLVDIPTVITSLTSGTALLNELRGNIYDSTGVSRVTQNVWLNRVYLLHTGIRVLATGVSIVLFISYKENRRLINLFALSSLLNNLRLIIVQVGRGEMVFIFLLYVCTIYLMRDYLSDNTKKKLILASIPVVIVGAAFFWAISVSRFGSNAGFFMYKYLGEPMNNFNGILWKNIKGHTNGQAYFSLIYRYIFGQTTATTAYEKWDLIQSTTGIRGDIFYTWVGPLIIEFGKIVPIVVAVVLNRSLSGISRIKKFYTGDIILLIFFLNFYLRGVFVFATQNFEGMTMIFYAIVLYFAFRIGKTKNGRLVYILPKSRKKRY